MPRGIICTQPLASGSRGWLLGSFSRRQARDQGGDADCNPESAGRISLHTRQVAGGCNSGAPSPGGSRADSFVRIRSRVTRETDTYSATRTGDQRRSLGFLAEESVRRSDRYHRGRGPGRRITNRTRRHKGRGDRRCLVGAETSAATQEQVTSPSSEYRKPGTALHYKVLDVLAFPP